MEMKNILIGITLLLAVVFAVFSGMYMAENKELKQANLDLIDSLNNQSEVVREVNANIISMEGRHNEELVIEFNKGVDSVELPVCENNVSIVPVDNENLDAVMEFIEDEFSEDLDVSYILFENEAKAISESFIREEIKDILDDEDFFDDGEALEDYRKSEVSIKKLYDAKVINRDFEDKDLELSYEVKVRAKEDGEDKEYFVFEIITVFDEGSFESEDVEIKLL